MNFQALSSHEDSNKKSGKDTELDSSPYSPSPKDDCHMKSSCFDSHPKAKSHRQEVAVRVIS